MFKVMDLFCGTGGFSKGFEATNQFEVVHGIDLLPVAVETFRANHPESFSIASDIRKVRRIDVSNSTGLKRGEVDVIIGGPPCQGFSSIRPFRSANEDDPRNSLFEEFASYVNYFRPRLLVMENVVGLATYEKGRTINQILETFSSLGYECDWKILNASNYGVPQKRERLILVGIEKGGKFIFPPFTHASATKTIGHRNHTRMHQLKNVDQSLFDFEVMPNLPPAITVNEAISDLPPITSGQSAGSYHSPPKNEYQAARRQNAEDVLTLHSSTKHSEKMLEIIRHSGDNISSIPKHLIGSGFSSCYSRLRGDEPSVTITVNFVHPASNKCIHPDLDRALTPREGARLQSYDDDFKFMGNRAQIVKQIGNAVPPLLGHAIAKSVLSALTQSH
jgi:DNA (cytosine-5)-methyltransferase 1